MAGRCSKERVVMLVCLSGILVMTCLYYTDTWASRRFKSFTTKTFQGKTWNTAEVSPNRRTSKQKHIRKTKVDVIATRWNQDTTGSTDDMESSTIATDSSDTQLSVEEIQMEKNPEKVRLRFNQRRAHLDKVCQRPDIATQDRNAWFKDDRLSILVRSSLYWCRVPKVGTTYIKSTFGRGRLKENRGRYSYNPKNKNHQSFFFVREPYSRLVSGFLDKVLLQPNFMPRLGVDVMRAAGVLSSGDNWFDKCSIYAAFPDFIRYFIQSEISSNATKNIHFVPFHDQCRICEYNYTFIGHLETFIEDISYIFDSNDIDVKYISNSEFTINGKCLHALEKGERYVRQCTDRYTVMKTLWWSFQVRGYIPESSEMPVSRMKSKTLPTRTFIKLVLAVYKKTKGTFDHSLQKRSMMVKMYLQVPLKDRMQVRDILREDFVMFQYEPQPKDLFPELS